MDWKEQFDKQFSLPSNLTKSGFAVGADIEVIKTFISTEILEKLIEEATRIGFKSYPNADAWSKDYLEDTIKFKQQLRDKWL